MGHILDKEGLNADPDKTAAVVKMEPLKSVSELRRFLGMANQLGKFSPSLADLTKPLRELLSSKVVWTWGPKLDEAFQDVKKELAKSTVLDMCTTLKQKLEYLLTHHPTVWGPFYFRKLEKRGNQSSMPREHYQKLNKDMPKLRKKLWQ